MANAVGESRNNLRLSISSISTTSSGASSIASGRALSCSSPESSTSSPPRISMSTLEDMGDDSDHVVTKIEEAEEEEGSLMNIPPLPTSPTEVVPGKRGRGRPRKNPIPPKTVQKVTKGRSKTGCITCRRRKKKCDETKPECNNCVKNAVVCEGYPEKHIWQPGRPKTEGGGAIVLRLSAVSNSDTGRSSSVQLIFQPLPLLVDGIETATDRNLLNHFTKNVSRILTLFDTDSRDNPLVKLLLPRAFKRPALMHSLLSLAGSHLSRTTNDPTLEEAQRDHFVKACAALRGDIGSSSNAKYDEPLIGATLVLCLDTIAKGSTTGEYRAHLNAARQMLATNRQQELQQQEEQDSEITEFRRFLWEFQAYHDVVSQVTSATLPRQPLMDNLTLPGFVMQPEAGMLLGVLDGLFGYLSKITLLRDSIRDRKKAGIVPAVDYEIFTQAVAIDAEVRDWQPSQNPGTHRYIAAQLYRQCTWVYLYRTVQPSVPSLKIKETVDVGLEYLRHLPEQSGTQSILLLPLFILGCAAFDPDQRPEIEERFLGLQSWSGLGNIGPAMRVVERVWELMDAGNEDLSWDWESIIENMGYDFLVT